MDIKITVNSEIMNEIPHEVQVTTKFQRKHTMDIGLEVIPTVSNNNKGYDVNKVIFARPSLKKTPTRSYTGISKLRNHSNSNLNNVSQNELIKTLLTMGNY